MHFTGRLRELYVVYLSVDAISAVCKKEFTNENDKLILLDFSIDSLALLKCLYYQPMLAFAVLASMLLPARSSARSESGR